MIARTFRALPMRLVRRLGACLALTAFATVPAHSQNLTVADVQQVIASAAASADQPASITMMPFSPSRKVMFAKS